jgi:hypothetical protein
LSTGGISPVKITDAAQRAAATKINNHKAHEGPQRKEERLILALFSCVSFVVIDFELGKRVMPGGLEALSRSIPGT